MKKLLALILTMALITTTGCDSSDPGTSNSGNLGNLGNSAVNSGSPGGITSNTNDQANPAENPGGTDPQAETALTVLCDGHITLNTPGCSTADGYYSMQNYLGSGDEYRITYIDYASGQEVILCSDSSCSHNSERCSSFVTGFLLESELFFWDGHLYYFEASNDHEGSLSAGGSWTGADGEPSYSTVWVTPAKLYRMNPDGTNRELVYSFPENLTVELVVVGGKNGLWFIQKENVLERDEKTGASHVGSKNKALVKLDLSEKKIVEQIPIPTNDNISKDFVGVYNNKLIFEGIAYPDGKSIMEYIDILAPRPTMAEEIAHMAEHDALMAKCGIVFFELDVSDKTMKEIYRTGYDRFKIGYTKVGDRIFFPTADNSAFSLDLNSGTTEDFNVPSGYMLDGFVGERPLFVMPKEPYERVLTAPETGEMIPWVLDGGTHYITAISGDLALVIYELVGTPTPTGGVRNPYNQYALISLDDLYHGRKNFKKIDMLERNNK